MNIETIIQGGAVAIAVFLIWYMDRRDKRSQETNTRKDDQITNIVTNHINHSNQVMENLTGAIHELKTTIVKTNGKK